MYSSNSNGYSSGGNFPTLNNMIQDGYSGGYGYNSNGYNNNGYNNNGYNSGPVYGPPQGFPQPIITAAHPPYNNNYNNSYPPQGYGPYPTNYPMNQAPVNSMPAMNPVPSMNPMPMPINPGPMPVNPIPVVSGMVQGTGMPLGPYNAQAYCQMLHDAVHGVGTDEHVIINVICSTTSEQRAEIRRVYSSMFGKDLIKRLKEDLSGNFEDTVCGCFMTHPEYDAYCLYKAMKGIGTNEGVLIEIIGTRNNYELQQIKLCFESTYGKSLEKWVSSETSGYLKKLLIALLQCSRSENPVANLPMCQTDAQALYQAGEGRWGTDESTFIRIFAQRSPAELLMIANCYQQLRGKSLLNAIDNEFSGDIKKLLKTIVEGMTDLPAYYANRLRNAVQGAGTNDSRLVRIIVSRCEVDMPQIKMAYQRLFGRDLLSDVRDDTSGYYQQLLSYLISRV